jgi:hypothetical protein
LTRFENHLNSILARFKDLLLEGKWVFPKDEYKNSSNLEKFVANSLFIILLVLNIFSFVIILVVIILPKGSPLRKFCSRLPRRTLTGRGGGAACRSEGSIRISQSYTPSLRPLPAYHTLSSLFFDLENRRKKVGGAAVAKF